MNLTTDGAGAVVLVGGTRSTTGIASAGALQGAKIGGFSDGFVAKFSADGELLWGTYVAGMGEEYVYAAAVDANDDVYVAGSVYPNPLALALPGPHDTTFNGSTDVFLLKLTAAGDLAWGTYTGSAGPSEYPSLAVAGDRVVLAADSAAPGLATPDGFDTTPNGELDLILSSFTTEGVLQWATYYGGEDEDSIANVAIAAGGEIFVGAATRSKTGIAMGTPYQASHGGGALDGFVVRFDAGGAPLWATYFGGASDDSVGGLAVDPAGDLLFAGQTQSPAGIATEDALQPALAGAQDNFVAKLDAAGALRWSTYLGGTEDEASLVRGALAAKDIDRVYVVGTTPSTSGLTTPDAFQPDFSGGFYDGTLVRLTQGLGTACAADEACETGACVDGVCCDGPCGGSVADDCAACSVIAGALVDGRCAPLSADTVCRPAVDACDAPELCSGDVLACPSDQPAPDADPCEGGACEAGVCVPDAADTSTTDASTTTGTDADTTDTTLATVPTTPLDPGTTTALPTGSGAPDSDAAPGSTGGAGSTSTGSSGESAGSTSDTDGGCGCTSGHVPWDMSILAPLLLARRRRLRSRP